ncbi:MAG: cytosine permease [Actinomycetales bacterium]|nr:cytosine permease [Actinomycetales bacterium]
MSAPVPAIAPPALQVEVNGINVIPEAERHGTPRSLFWPWATASISLFNVSIAGLLVAFGMGFLATALAAAVGIIASFFLVGQISLAGKRASAPTMVISRAAFGVRGNSVPTFISYLTLVGWEIVAVVTTVMAATTVLNRLGWYHGIAVEAIVFILVVLTVVTAGVFGFRLVTRFQTVVTIASIAMVLVFIALTVGTVQWSALTQVGEVSFAAIIGVMVVAAAAFGLGWTNSGADYSRYLPRNSSGRAIVGWTTFAGSLVPVTLVVYGLMLVTSQPSLTAELGANPIGALITLLPTSALLLLPFLLIVSLGTTGAGAMDLYSSGLTLLTLGLRVPRAVAAGIDGVLMVLGSLYLLWFAGSFFGPFEGFLILLGVPLAAWAGAFIADAITRRGDYAGPDLFRASGRYGSMGWPALGSMIAGTVIGWGLVSADTTAPLLAWQGFLLDALGFPPQSIWRASDVGVIVALIIGFVGTRLVGRARVAQEDPAPARASESSRLPA